MGAGRVGARARPATRADTSAGRLAGGMQPGKGSPRNSEATGVTAVDVGPVDRLATPVGTLVLEADAAGAALVAVTWVEGELPSTGALPHLRQPLEAWLAGHLTALDTIPVAPLGTAFQVRVWAALRTIPPGSTWSYGHLARHLGRPEAVRAVAGANATNPVAVVVPCHRVIGRDGSLTGYAGGLERKRWLLAHEGAFGPLGA